MLNKNNIQSLEEWLNIIHNDLYILHTDNMNSGDDSKLRNELAGFRDSFLYDACSGVGYIYDNKYYSDVSEIKDLNMDNIDDIKIDRVISVDYLLNFLDQILRK